MMFNPKLKPCSSELDIVDTKIDIKEIHCEGMGWTKLT